MLFATNSKNFHEEKANLISADSPGSNHSLKIAWLPIGTSFAPSRIRQTSNDQHFIPKRADFCRLRILWTMFRWFCVHGVVTELVSVSSRRFCRYTTLLTTFSVYFFHFRFLTNHKHHSEYDRLIIIIPHLYSTVLPLHLPHVIGISWIFHVLHPLLCLCVNVYASFSVN